MDGTLLRHEFGISNRNSDAIRNIMVKGVPFFIATGRSRKSAAQAAGQRFVDLLGGDVNRLSGVYSQGLVVFGKEGMLIHESFLSSDVIEDVELYCQKHRISLIVYAGDRILTAEQTDFTRGIVCVKEPMPELQDTLLHQLHRIGVKINKLILLEAEEILIKHRPDIEKRLRGVASLTKAVPGMLEVLPFGASKGAGVRLLLDHFALGTEGCVAFGDGENDKEMLQLVEHGVAVANAHPELKRHAKLVTLSNQEDGVAVVLEHIHGTLLSTPKEFNTDTEAKLSDL